MPLSETNITEAILMWREEWIKSGTHSYWAINNGNCESFALDVIDYLIEKHGDEGESCELISDGYLIDDDENFCPNAIEQELGMTIELKSGTTWDAINRIPFGSHYWIYFNGRHYDAECPTGVCNFFDLPLYKRYIDRYL